MLIVYLIRIYIDTCIDKENHEADTNIDFGLLTTKDIDPYLNSSDNCMLSACTLICNSYPTCIALAVTINLTTPALMGTQLPQHYSKQDTSMELIQTKLYPCTAHVMALQSCVPLTELLSLTPWE